LRFFGFFKARWLWGRASLLTILVGVILPVRVPAVTGWGWETKYEKPVTSQAAPVSTRPDQSRTLFGVINDQERTGHYADEWARGVRATVLELHWSAYEPQEGVYDLDYIGSKKELMQDLKAQGWYVQLVPGYQYVPDWVFANYPGMRYVNQYGHAYDPDPGAQASFRVINAPFNPEARALIAGYIQRIFADFDQTDPSLRFDAVRVGGGVQGELRYPPPDWNGVGNSYWAFDAAAQNPAISEIPPSVVGWRPGIDANPGSVGRGQLIVHPGFEGNHPRFSILGWSPDDEVIVEVTPSNPHGGAQALSLTIATPHRAHQFVRVEPGTTYHMGGWLKSEDGVGRARIFFVQYDAATDKVLDAPFVKLENQSAEWSEQSGSLTTAPTTRYLKVEMDGDRPGTFIFDDLWLRREGETDDRNRDIDVPLAFYDWYVQKLTDYQNWQIDALRKYFPGQLDLVYAGKGLRPNRLNDALTNDLSGDGWSEASSALYGAALYGSHVAELSGTGEMAVYLTGIDEPAAHEVDDASPNPSDWSAARWMAYLARRVGLPVWGENSGQDDAVKMALSAQRMQANGFSGLMWAFESELYADPNPDGYATMDDYAAIIAIYTQMDRTYLPVTVRYR
jgi:hypothetical protein